MRQKKWFFHWKEPVARLEASSNVTGREDIWEAAQESERLKVFFTLWVFILLLMKWSSTFGLIIGCWIFLEDILNNICPPESPHRVHSVPLLSQCKDGHKVLNDTEVACLLYESESSHTVCGQWFSAVQQSPSETNRFENQRQVKARKKKITYLLRLFSSDYYNRYTIWVVSPLCLYF